VVAFGGRNLTRGLVPLDGGNLLVFINLNASEIWLYKGGGLSSNQRPPPLYSQISDAFRLLNTNKLPPSRGTNPLIRFLQSKATILIQPDFRCI
jgi:hypothetical protein